MTSARSFQLFVCSDVYPRFDNSNLGKDENHNIADISTCRCPRAIRKMFVVEESDALQCEQTGATDRALKTTEPSVDTKPTSPTSFTSSIKRVGSNNADVTQALQMCSCLPAEIEDRARLLVNEFRESLCKMLGPPIFERKSLDFRQSTDGPMIRIDRDNATIYVGPYAVLCESTLVSNLAHETVHLHVGDGIPGLASGLEEGFAVYFELTKVAQQFGELERQIHVAHLPASYQNALRDYDYLMTRVENPASLAFNSFGKLTGLSWLEIRQIFPGIGWRMIYRLTRRRRMRPG